MKKKLITLLLCAAASLSLGACGDADTSDTQSAGGTASQPKIETMASYENLNEVLSEDYEITDELIDAYLAEVLYGAGVGLREVTDRDVVQEGDIVLADYTGYLDGTAFDNGAATDQWIDVSNNSGFDTSTGSSAGSFIDGFAEGMIGAKKEQTVEHNVTFPEGYSDELGGKETTFEFTVHGIYVPMTKDSIDDAFVKENLSEKYEVSTVDELMAFLEEELAYSYTMNYLIQNSTYDISEDYLNERLEDYQSYFEELYCGENSLEDYLAYYGTTVESMQTQWLSALEAQVKNETVFATIVEEQGLELDEKGHEEYVQKIISVNSSYFPDEDSIYKYAGAGNSGAGEKYLKTQTAVRDYMKEKYRDAAAE